MKIAVIQFCPVWGDKEKNVNRIINFIDSIDADILVFPELCTSGYFFLDRKETEKISESFTGKTVTLVQNKATDQNKIIVFGFAEKDENSIYNSAAILFPDSKLSDVYRKTHLFYKERFCFDEGNKGYFVIEDKQRDIRLGTMICYDWRFPEASRTLALKGADIIVCPSNLVTDVWHLAMPARALENKLYLAVANRTGTEKRENEELFFNGMSAIYSYNGKAMEIAGTHDEAVIYSEINPLETRDKSFNEYNDILTDRRPEYYIIK